MSTESIAAPYSAAAKRLLRIMMPVTITTRILLLLNSSTVGYDSVPLCVCVCIYICIHIYIHTCIYIHAYIHTYIQYIIYILCVCVCVYAYTYTCIYKYINVQV